MQRETIYAAPATGNAPVLVKCKQVSSRMLLKESVATDAALQGFIYNLATPDGAGGYTYGPDILVPPQLEPELIAGYPGDHPPNQVPIGNGGSSPYPVCPGGPVTTGTVICKLRSASATPTSVVAIEN